tara:strand:- start:46 stop:186 length:141 start_codon:yes stop_codon:yes gene_type:complete
MENFKKNNININNINIEETINILNTYGVIVFRNFFNEDKIFEKNYH